MPRPGALALLISKLLLLAGCGGEDPPPMPPPPGSLEIGTGALDGSAGFVNFPSGADLTLAPGSQGGFHVFLNLRLDEGAREAVGELPLVGRVARRVADGVLVSRTTRRVRLVARDDGYETEASLPLFLCPTPIGVVVGDQPIELTVTVSDAEESQSLEVRVRFTPRCPVEGTEMFCTNICFG